MIVSLFTTIFVLFSQGLAPAGYEYYGFELKNETEYVYGLAMPSELENGMFIIRVVEPWNRSAKEMQIRKSNVIDHWLELPNSRKSRIDGIWESHNGTKIGDRWVSSVELKLATRAQDLMSPRVEDTVVVDAPKVGVATSEPTGFVAQWWLHIVIGVGSVVSIGVTVWWGFLRQTWVGIS